MDTVFGVRDFDKEYTVADYLDASAFDEKFEIDVVKDTIHNIYHIENKYYVPILDGSFREVYNYGRKHMVDRDDTEFHELLNPDTLMERFEKASPKGTLKAECRQRLIDGSYRWVQYLGITGKENGVPDGICYFYVYDIQNQKDRQNGKLSVNYSINNRNELTGLLVRESFIPYAVELTKKFKRTWCCVAIDIQHFKIFNEWYGRDKGTMVLARIGNILSDFEQNEKAVASYFGRDNFGVFLPYEEESIQYLYDSVREIILTYSNNIGFLPAIGVYILKENKVDLGIYDKARIAVANAKETYINRIQYFDNEAYTKKREEYKLLTDFQYALKNGEISFYLQPQCALQSGKIVGAEALARWIRKDGTIVSPGAFVPFLEKNGFITDLDKAVWEEVVKWIRGVIDLGIRPLPVSINVSQVDLLTMDVPSYLYGLVQRYNIPARLLKVEITESAYAENFELISKTVSSIRDKGFKVFMDDFGAGYSSLNMLDKINVDVLKLDMIFMRKNTWLSKRGISIVESIVSMTKTLGLPVIVEGVETEEQLAFLNNLGCRYAQGYYFYKPMPKEQYVGLLRNRENLDFKELSVRTTELFHTKDFLNEALFTDAMLNNILGPVAFYSLDQNNKLNIVRFNQQFYECIADVDMESRKSGIQDYVLEEDISLLEKMLEDAYNDTLHGGQCTVRFTKSKGGVFWYNMHLFFLRENENGKLFYGKIANVTSMYEQGRSFFEVLRMNSDSCMRIDLKSSLIYELGKNKTFDDPTARVMDVIECLTITAKYHIHNEEDRKQFVEFFLPERLKKSHEAGIYSEAFQVDFLFGEEIGKATFSAYYIKFVPDQDDNVYIFVNRQKE